MLSSFEMLKNLILRLFGRKVKTSGYDAAEATAWAESYKDISRPNFTAIFAKKLASLAVAQSTITVLPENNRAEYIGAQLSNFARKSLKTVAASALGYGATVVVPYAYIDAAGKFNIALSYVPKSKFFINEFSGDKISSATMICDEISDGINHYARLADYTLDNGACVIRQRCTANGSPAPLTSVSDWANIPDEIRVPGCSKLLLAYFKSPVDRRDLKGEGAPITYGCDTTIEQIQLTLDEIKREYKNTEIFIGVDSTMFDGDNRLPKNGVFKRFDTDSDSFWNVFNPEIRSTAYAWRINQLFEQLEKEVGTSKGILTTPDAAATATEVIRAQHDTWVLVDDIRRSLERGINDLAYCYDVLANYYAITPQGDYSITYDWDYSLLEDSAETFNQLVTGKSLGAVSTEELRQFIYPAETIEQARAAVETIKNEAADVRLTATDE